MATTGEETISVLFATAGGDGEPRLSDVADFDVAVRSSERIDGFDEPGVDAIVVDEGLAGGEVVVRIVEDVDAVCVLADETVSTDTTARTIRRAVSSGWDGFPVPADEVDRLEAVDAYDVDEPTLAAHLDGLTTTARDCLDASVGFVGLVGEEEEVFATAQGVDWETLDREHAVCAHTITGDGSTVISDLAVDERVTEEALEGDFDPDFYAGVPLTSSDGHPIGALCVMHDEPIEFDEDDERALRWLAEQATDHLERYGRTE